MLRTLAALTVAAVAPQSAGAQSSPSVGQPFPIYELPLLQRSSDAKTRRSSIAAYRGKKLLLVQFASW